MLFWRWKARYFPAEERDHYPQPLVINMALIENVLQRSHVDSNIFTSFVQFSSWNWLLEWYWFQARMMVIYVVVIVYFASLRMNRTHRMLRILKACSSSSSLISKLLGKKDLSIDRYFPTRCNSSISRHGTVWAYFLHLVGTWGFGNLDFWVISRGRCLGIKKTHLSHLPDGGPLSRRYQNGVY